MLDPLSIVTKTSNRSPAAARSLKVLQTFEPGIINRQNFVTNELATEKTRETLVKKQFHIQQDL